MAEDTNLATDDYIKGMDQAYGVFAPERFRQGITAAHTEDAKDVVREIRDNFNKGDPITRHAVHDWEVAKFGEHYKPESYSDYLSKDKLTASTAWEIFYTAHSHYMSHDLENEDKELTPEETKQLQSWVGFDMGGDKNPFPFERLHKAGRLHLKGLNGR